MVEQSRVHLQEGHMSIMWKDTTFNYAYFLWFEDSSVRRTILIIIIQLVNRSRNDNTLLTTKRLAGFAAEVQDVFQSYA